MIKHQNEQHIKQYQPLIIAHRGESHDAPENTLAAVNLAWKRGASAVEVDIHVTADQKIVVIHDSSTERTTGRKLIINKTSMSDLKKLDAGSWKGSEWAEEKIPGLAEVLATVSGGGKVLLEIKSGAGMLKKLRQQTEESGLLSEQIEIIAEDLNTLATAKQCMPHLKMLWVIECGAPWRRYLSGMHPKAIIRKLRKHGIDGITIGDSRCLTRSFVEEFTSRDIPVYTWTVNDPSRAAELLTFGVDGITTDRAAWMKKSLKEALKND
ncbi:MAG: glycerophosphodiester phosphodiesterase family protein [Balneolales bacterium]